jgi:hypothetical protein
MGRGRDVGPNGSKKERNNERERNKNIKSKKERKE